MKGIIEKCECGSIRFLLYGTKRHESVIDRGVLKVTKTQDPYIEIIICENCNNEYLQEEVKDIIWQN